MLGPAALFTAIAAVQVVANPIRSSSRTPYRVKESHFVPRQWKRVERAPADHVIHLQIGIKQGDFETLERYLYEVSDPDDVRYGQHLSADEVRELVKPSEETLGLVHEWLEDNGAVPSSYSAAKDWLMVSLPVSQIEALLDTEYYVYEHEEGARLVRASKWSLPMHLHEHIDTIQPTTSFFRARAQKSMHIDEGAAGFVAAGYTPPSNETINAVCNVSSVTPECFETLYQTKGYTTQAAGKNQVGFTNYLTEHPIRTDLSLFLAKYRPEAIAQADRKSVV